MHKNQYGFHAVLIAMLALVISGIGLAGWYVYVHRSSTQDKLQDTAQMIGFTKDAIVSDSGEVTSLDLEAMTTDGPGNITVKSAAHGTVALLLSSGRSTCDRQAVITPVFSVGDNVAFAGTVMEDDQPQLLLCKAGTYIHLSTELIQACPDEWIEDRMPTVGNNDSSRQYFIIDGGRKEVTDYDVDWIKTHCSVKMQAVY